MFGSTLPVEICALENDDSLTRNYGKQVTNILHTFEIEQYRKTAEAINERLDIGMVCIQHEFGLFDGIYGDSLLSFMLTVNKPIATVFHTVLPKPDEKRKKIVQAIYDLSAKIIVQTRQSCKIFVEDYDCSDEVIEVIPHGTHIVLWKNKTRLKEKYGYKNNIVLTTFGLLGENKSIETVLHALPEIVEKHPETRYLVLGKTHPEIFKKDGEQYRNKLIEITKKLNLEDHVIFLNKYFELNELLEYLNLSDIYLFSSKDPHQAVSGTFAYAKSAGCPVISTPIPHAREVIDDNTGILLTEFEQPEEFKKAILSLINNKERRIELGKNAFSKMRASSWENAALAYGKIFGELTNKAEDLGFRLPPINLEHIHELTTDFGMLQFSNFCQADPDSGYTLDDNARALIATVMHYDMYKEETVLKLVDIYLKFVEFVQQKDGRFDNYVDFGHNFTEQNKEVNLEDPNGRALWALGFVLSRKNILPGEWVERAERCWQKALPVAESLTSPRAIAFTLKGLYYHHRYSCDHDIIQLADIFASRLLDYYHLKSEPDWHWYEDYMTYANSVLPEAMMYAYLLTGKKYYKDIAVITFDFLLSHYFMKGKIQVISNKGWFHKRNKRLFYGEQPIEVAYTIFTLELFYEVTGENKYKTQLEIAFSWFLGNNHLNQIMYNPANGSCYDGLEENHVNINQGAESSVCYLIASLIMEKHIVRNISSFSNQLLLLY